MRQLLLTFSMFLVFGSFSLHAKKRIIESPDYEAKNTGLYSVERIELSDTDTRIHIKSSFLPNWWVMFSARDYIRNSENGDKLYALDIINGEFDKEIYMPASGDSTFILIFPPLDKNVKKIDFADNGIPCIWGISLEKPKKNKKEQVGIPVKVEDWLTSEINKAPRTERKDWTESFFMPDGNIRLIGYIKGFDSRYNMNTGIVYASNEVTREDYPTVVEIHPDGRFEANIPASYPKLSYISFDRRIIPFYGEPGMVTAIILDWGDFLLADRYRDRSYEFELTEFRGSLARLNQEILSVKYPGIDYRSFQDKMKNQSYTDYKKEILENWQNAKNILSKSISSGNLLPETIDILKRKIDIDFGVALFDFAMSKSYYVENSQEHPVPKDYYDFLSTYAWDDPLLMIPDNFSIFINRFEYMEPLWKAVNKANDLSSPKKTLLEYMEEDLAINFSTEDILYKNMSDSADYYHSSEDISPEERQAFQTKIEEAAQQFSTKYSTEITDFTRIYLDPLRNIGADTRTILELQVKDSIMWNHLTVHKSLLSDIPKVRGLDFTFKNCNKKEAENILAYLKDDLQDEILKVEAERIYNIHFLHEGEGYELPDVKAADVFRQIIEPYKGKYLLVDFWGIFCGPCISNIKKEKENRARLKEHPNMEFIFITSEEESPKQRYEAFVAEQELIHTFSISADDYKYLRQLFRFNGIPRYVFIDPQGRILDDNYNPYSFERDVEQRLSGKTEL